jgi:nucleoside-diphosphate-sugar epimerase/lipopolysaccharide/colanic/teichoic acid biosynthesis glycosyltransferase
MGKRNIEFRTRGCGARLLITGATGFIGGALVKASLAAGQSVLAVTRSQLSMDAFRHPNLRWFNIDGINDQTNWQPALQTVNAVVHCAARVHAGRSQSGTLISAYRDVNVMGTLNLAQQSAAAGVERFVFISSIGVNGCSSFVPLNESSPLQPYDYYSRSKLEAEQGLMELAERTKMEIVIIRPPLVYGPGAPGNFSTLVRWVLRGVPLPLAGIRNQRSLVAVNNLVNLILLCSNQVRSPQAANQVFVVSDCDDVTTSSLLSRIARAADRPSRLFWLPSSLIKRGAQVFGKGDLAERLLGDLQVDSTKARLTLGWYPICTMEEQLAAMFPAKELPDYHSHSILRLLDVLLATIGLLLLWPLMLLIYLVAWFDTQSPLFIQKRVGRHQEPFFLVKFRTMRLETADVPSHLISRTSITRFGAFLRRTKLDELPQLWNVLLGHMSLVGPRPSLYNQPDLIDARQVMGIYKARPGITGLAQVLGVDMSTPELLAKTDANMLRELSVASYFKYIFLTIAGKGSGDGIKK